MNENPLVFLRAISFMAAMLLLDLEPLGKVLKLVTPEEAWLTKELIA